MSQNTSKHTPKKSQTSPRIDGSRSRLSTSYKKWPQHPFPSYKTPTIQFLTLTVFADQSTQGTPGYGIVHMPPEARVIHINCHGPLALTLPHPAKPYRHISRSDGTRWPAYSRGSIPVAGLPKHHPRPKSPMCPLPWILAPARLPVLQDACRLASRIAFAGQLARGGSGYRSAQRPPEGQAIHVHCHTRQIMTSQS